MYIHIGERKIISDKKCVGIFNADTLKKSELNSWILKQLNPGDKTAVIDIQNNVFSSKVSPFTVMKREDIYNELFWRKEDE